MTTVGQFRPDVFPVPQLIVLVSEVLNNCLQCFDTVGWAAGRASGLYKKSGGVPAWLSVWLSGYLLYSLYYLQCFDAVGWAAGRASGL